MRTYRAVAWKELHELRWLWYAGVSVVVVLPLLQEVFSAIFNPWSNGMVMSMTLTLGVALAILVACSTACRDLHEGVPRCAHLPSGQHASITRRRPADWLQRPFAR